MNKGNNSAKSFPVVEVASSEILTDLSEFVYHLNENILPWAVFRHCINTIYDSLSQTLKQP